MDVSADAPYPSGFYDCHFQTLRHIALISRRTWLPVASQHLERAALDMAARDGSVYREFAAFLKWRKAQPAMMEANRMSEISGGPDEIIFDRLSDRQSLRCRFDFRDLTASFDAV